MSWEAISPSLVFACYIPDGDCVANINDLQRIFFMTLSLLTLSREHAHKNIVFCNKTCSTFIFEP
jgi:hypothetical protein